MHTCSKQCVYWISVSTHNVNTQQQIFWQELGAVSQQECLWMDVMNILTNPISHHVPEATKIPVKAPHMAPKPYHRQAGLLHFQLLSWVHAHLKLIPTTHDEELTRSKSHWWYLLKTSEVPSPQIYIQPWFLDSLIGCHSCQNKQTIALYCHKSTKVKTVVFNTTSKLPLPRSSSSSWTTSALPTTDKGPPKGICKKRKWWQITTWRDVRQIGCSGETSLRNDFFR